MTDIAARFSALNITWMGAPAFENLPNGKAILKDAETLLAKLDPYNHPRTSMAEATSSPLLADRGDQWLSFLSYGTADPNVGAVEHQFFGMPAVNTGIQSERDLWNATMNGQYPASGSGKYMTAWFDFMSGNRYWELEPYFDVDGGRAMALEDVEYIVYVEKPGTGGADGRGSRLRRGLDQSCDWRTDQGEGVQRQTFHGRASRQIARLGAAGFARRAQGRDAEVL